MRSLIMVFVSFFWAPAAKRLNTSPKYSRYATQAQDGKRIALKAEERASFFQSVRRVELSSAVASQFLLLDFIAAFKLLGRGAHFQGSSLALPGACRTMLSAQSGVGFRASAMVLHDVAIVSTPGVPTSSPPSNAGTAESDSTKTWFEAAVQLCETHLSTAPDELLSVEVPRLLHRVFDADFERLMRSEKAVRNLTCMQPAEDDFQSTEGGSGRHFDHVLEQLPLRPGRICYGGNCCDACSRVILPYFATDSECEAFIHCLDSIMLPRDEYPRQNLYLQNCSEAGNVRATLSYIRLLERLRRAIAHEYGLRLSGVAVKQTFVARKTEKCNPGSLHVDESSFSTAHYSSVLYLNAQHQDFEGGGLVFRDRLQDPSGEPILSRVKPKTGLTVLFSSGWENPHIVEKVVSGCRFAVPTFFVTTPEHPRLALADDRESADALRMILRPKTTNDYKQFMNHWHRILAPRNVM